MAIISTILDIVFPARCLSCGKRGMDLCFDCISTLPKAERECAKWIFPLFDYRHPIIKKSIHKLKYGHKRKLAFVFAEAIHQALSEELADLAIMENFQSPVLIPIPLAPTRRSERGFNQAELICQNLLKQNLENILELDKNILFKPKDTKHQSHIENRTERLRNVIGSFVVKNEERIKGRNIILIDDVTTTGATLAEARKVLKQSGARKIIAFTVAH